jgi:small-conductance mechanosensitive channel
VDGAAAMSPQDFASQRDFMKKTAHLYRAVNAALGTANELQGRLKTLRAALHEVPAAEEKLEPAADAIEKQNNEILRALRGDTALAAHNENIAPAINDRVTGILDGERFSLAKPTQTHIGDYATASQELAAQSSKLKSLIQTGLANLERAMEAAGAPWTPGRLIDWDEK